MEMRVYGRTGMRLSVLGFGCGAVGGLMVRGDPRDQERAVARALAVGVNYFDTAVQYGDGELEKNLGRVLQNLKPADAVVGTKVRLPSAEFGRIAAIVTKSLDGSLARLRRERVDIFHLHNAITEHGGGEALSVPQVLEEASAWRWCRRSSGCANRARPVFSGSPRSVTRPRCIGSSTPAASTARKWSTTCSMRRPRRRCLRTIRRRIMAGCSITPRRRALASSVFVCSPAARYPALPNVTRLPVRHRNRSARP